MSDTNEKQREDSQRKRKALAVLMAICQGGDRGSEFLDVYLEAAENISADIFCEACALLTRTWDNVYTFPRPYHVLESCRELIRGKRRVERAIRDQRLNEQLQVEAMSPDKAMELLADLEARDPEGLVGAGRAAVEIQRSLLRIAAARGDNTPRLKPETEETS